MNAEQRQEIERKVVRHLIRAMKEKGWKILYINDGGEDDENIHNPNETLAMDTVFSVAESWIFFSKPLPDGRKIKHMAYIVLGNDGYDCIADHGCALKDEPLDDFEQIMEEVQAYADKFCE